MRTSRPVSTAKVQTRLRVDEEGLDGLKITVWYPWYGVEASLFESFARDFNQENPWGIVVSTQGQVNFTNIYESVNSALPTADRPDLVIALPEHALEWNSEREVAELTPYVEDPRYGIDSSDIPLVFWYQDTSGTARVAVPAQRTGR